MNFFSRLLGSVVSKLKAIPQRVGAWRDQVRARRSEAPKPPKGYREPQPVEVQKTSKPGSVPDVGQTRLPDTSNIVESAGDWDNSYIEYRDTLTEQLTSFDFPPELIERIGELSPEQLLDVDFTRLNAARDRLEKYRTAYENGTISFDDFDHDYYIHEINQSIPGLDWYPDETWKLDFFSGGIDADDWLANF